MEWAEYKTLCDRPDYQSKWLIKQNRDVILFCAGWKGRFNLEDTLFAGALVELLIASNLYESIFLS